MRPVRIIAAFTIAAAVAVAGCTAHSSTVGSHAGSTPVSSAPPPPTTAPPHRPTPNPPAPVPPSPRVRTPSLAAQRLLRAWQAHDRAAALRVASSRAVDAVFARSPRSLRDPAFGGCSTRDSGYDCVYSAGWTWLRLLVQGDAVAGYRVHRALFGDRITSPDTPARLLYQAWAADDYWAAQVWGGSKGARALFALPRERYAFKGCALVPPLGPFLCKWETERRGISISVTGGASAGYGVDKVETAPLPIP